MKIFVISLECENDRRENIRQQFLEMDIDYELVDAVNGKKSNHPLFERYNASRRIRIKGEPLTGGQLGCFASHFLVWQKCIEINEPVIIIEDDAIFNQNLFKEFLSNMDKLISSDIKCLRLFRNKSKHHSSFSVCSFENIEVRKYTKGHMSTTGYYLTPEGAGKFVDGAMEWVLPVDMYMDMFWRNKVECYGIEPPCVTNDHKFKSTIDYVPKSNNRRSWSTRFKREAYAARENFIKILYNTFFIIRYVKHRFSRCF